MKLTISILMCLIFLTSCDENSKTEISKTENSKTEISKTETNNYSVNIGSYKDVQNFEVYNFENFDKDVTQQMGTTLYKRVTSYVEFMLFLELLTEDNNISDPDFNQIEENFTHIEENFFEENTLIIAFLNAATTPYDYDCENIAMEEDSIVVTLQVSGTGDCDAEQNTFLFIETEQLPDDLPIQVRFID